MRKSTFKRRMARAIKILDAYVPGMKLLELHGESVRTYRSGITGDFFSLAYSYVVLDGDEIHPRRQGDVPNLPSAYMYVYLDVKNLRYRGGFPRNLNEIGGKLRNTMMLQLWQARRDRAAKAKLAEEGS